MKTFLKLCAICVICGCFPGSAFAQTGTTVTGTTKTADEKTPVQAGLKVLKRIGSPTTGTDVYGTIEVRACEVDSQGRCVKDREAQCGTNQYLGKSLGYVKGDGAWMAPDETAGIKRVPNAGCSPSGLASEFTITLQPSVAEPTRLPKTEIILMRVVPDVASIDFSQLTVPVAATPAAGKQDQSGGSIFDYEKWTRYAAASVPNAASGADNVFIDLADLNLKAKDSAGAVRNLGSAGGGSGDITDVGNCATAACFQAVAINQVFAGPASGGAGIAAMRALVAADVPNLDAAKITTGVFGDTQVADNITITLAATATALAANGANCSGNNFALGVDAAGVCEGAQPAFSNLSGAATDAQVPDTITASNYLPLAGGTLTGTVTLRAGAAGASTAPAKFQAGALNTVAEAHAFEWDGTDLYATNALAARKRLIYSDGSISGNAATATALAADPANCAAGQAAAGVTAAGVAEGCAAYVTSVSGTAEEIASSGGATPVLSIPAVLNLGGKTLKGASPLVFEGLTVDAFEITLVVTDPTAARSFTLPNADSVAIQPLTCGGSDKVSAVSALGVVTCTADQGGTGADNITVLATAATDANFGTLPAAPANAVNVVWQLDTAATPDNVSAHLLFSAIATATFGANADFTWTFDNAGATDPQFQFVAGVLTLAAMSRLDTPNELRNANAGALLVAGRAADGASAIGVRLNANTALTVAGAKITTFENNAVVKSSIDKDGGFSGNAATATALAVDPTTCTNQLVRDISAAGTLTCATVAKADAVSTFVSNDQTNTYSTGTQDFESAAVTRPYRRLAFASFPGTCTANREFLERSDPATAGQVVYVCNAAGTGWDLVGDGGAGGGITSLASQTGSTQTITRGAGIGGTSATNDHSFTTASGEADFLAGGALTCGAATQGAMKVHTTPLQYCDNAATPVLQYAAYGDSAGAALAGDTATAFFATGTVEDARIDAALLRDSELAAFTVTKTNLTLDVEGTGNSITTVSKIWLEAAACQNATATLMWDTPTTNPAVAACVTGTNTQKGVADFADGANSLSMQRTLALPADWAGAVDVKIKWLSATTTGDVVWQIATICVADAETDDPAFNTADAFTADTAKGTANQLNDATKTGITMTGCAAGEAWHIKVFRDPAHASDTHAATARLLGVELTLRRAQ